MKAHPHLLNNRANAYILAHPLAFVWQTLKGFRANQGLLLAGAVAYYALLSIVPFLMLAVVALSHFIDPGELLATLQRYLEWLVPGQSRPIVAEVAHFLEDRDLITWVLVATMLFFSSLAFTVLENAMSVIFVHRVAIRRRHFLVSAILPYCYILALGVGVLLVTLVAGVLQVMGEESLAFLGHDWSLGGVCEHLAKGMNYGIDGAPFKVQWYLRLLGPILRKRFLTRPMSPGFKLPTSASPYLPSRQAAESGVAELEQAIARQQKIRERKPHVIFGNMTPEEWDQLHFRHSEMHLSFIVPA